MKVPFPLVAKYAKENTGVSLMGYLIALDLVEKNAFTPDSLFSEFSKRFDVSTEEAKSIVLDGWFGDPSMVDLGMLEVDGEDDLKVVSAWRLMKRTGVKTKNAWIVNIEMDTINDLDNFFEWFVRTAYKAVKYMQTGSKVNFWG